MKPSLDDLALLVAIADEKGFSAASKALGLPKSTVSRRLSDLETDLHTSLFQRSTRSLSLTDEGRRIYALAKPAIDAARDAARAIGEREHTVTGRVAITTTAAIGVHLIAPHLAALTDQHPGLQIELRLTERRVDIVGDGIDLAVRMGPLNDSDLVARRLGKVRRRLVASPDYLRANGTPVTAADVASHNAIVTDSRRTTWRFADGWECDLRWNVAAGNMLVAHQLALAGHGIALLPDFLTHDDRIMGRLMPVLNDIWDDEADAWLVSSRQRYRSPAVRTVLDTLTALCADIESN